MSTFDNLKETVVNKIDELKSEFENNADTGIGLTEDDNKDKDRTESTKHGSSSNENSLRNDETISTTDENPHVETVDENYGSDLGYVENEIDPVEQFDEDYDLSREDVRTDVENDQGQGNADLYNTPSVNDERVENETADVTVDTASTDRDTDTPLYGETLRASSDIVREDVEGHSSELYETPVEDVEKYVSSDSDATRVGYDEEDEEPYVFEAP